LSDSALPQPTLDELYYYQVAEELHKPLLAAIVVHESLQRIPQPQRSGVTYYSELDTWLFHAIMDTRTCDLCRHYEDMEEIRGDQLRLEFPYHVILDENTIVGPAPDGSGLVHPNCRCYLTRLLQRED